VIVRIIALPALLATLVGLAGCATGRHSSPARVAGWENNPPALAPNPTPTPTQTPPPAPTPAPSVAPIPPPAAAAPTRTILFSETWVPLGRWCKAAGLPSPTCLSLAPQPTYVLKTANGELVFRIGSQVAHWNGVDLRLGFSPQWIDKQPYLHTLDLRKTLEPLIEGSCRRGSTSPPVLVLDPGHGGKDSGAKSAFERSWEKQFTLDWARRLQSLLVTNGWLVFLTRTSDQEIALSNRVAFAQQHNADLFLSLHFNAAGENKTQAGLETYCLTPVGMPSTITRGYEDDPALEFANNAFDAQNLQLALRLHRNLLDVNGHMDRGVRRARFLGVLRGQQRPAILIEGGYLSSPLEARRIADPAYRQKLAEAVARGLAMEGAWN